MPRFLAPNNLKPFVSEELERALTPLVFKGTGHEGKEELVAALRSDGINKEPGQSVVRPATSFQMQDMTQEQADRIEVENCGQA